MQDWSFPSSSSLKLIPLNNSLEESPEYESQSPAICQLRKSRVFSLDKRHNSGTPFSKLSIQIVGHPNCTKSTPQSLFQKTKRRKISTAKEFYSKYDILEKIGEGGSSVVKLCKEIDSQQILVVKIIKYADTERVFQIIQEEKILSGLEHPTIIKNHGFYIDTSKKTCFIIMEYAPGSSLTALLQEKFPFTNYKISQIAKDLLFTVSYLHLNAICHRDIAPDNIIFDTDTNKIKLIDFSISKDLGNCLINGKMYTQTGKIAFMAPELLQGKVYDKSIDIWGIGLTLLFTLLGYNPFADSNGCEMQTIKNIIEMDLDYSQFTHLDPKAIDLISKMLMKDPSQRVSINQALQHPWLEQKIDRQELQSKSPERKNQKGSLSPDRSNFKRHSIHLFSEEQFSFNLPSSKQNYRRGSLLMANRVLKVASVKEDSSSDDESSGD